VADTARTFPFLEDVTADFVYVRLHGAESLYASGYKDPQLDWWANRIEAWRAGGQPADPVLAAPDEPPRRLRRRDVYVYFDNDGYAHAPRDAISLAKKLGVGPAETGVAAGGGAPGRLAGVAEREWKRDEPPRASVVRTATRR
jgi:uncharacterized protein YecE (DUF72 family)